MLFLLSMVDVLLLLCCAACLNALFYFGVLFLGGLYCSVYGILLFGVWYAASVAMLHARLSLVCGVLCPAFLLVLMCLMSGVLFLLFCVYYYMAFNILCAATAILSCPVLSCCV